MPEPTLDLLTADGRQLMASVNPTWGEPEVFTERAYQKMAALRDAIVAAARSAPVGELTEAMVAQAFSETLDEQDSRDPFSIRDWDSLSAEKKRICVFFARAIARLARPSDAVLAEAKREGWDAARTFANEKWGITQRTEHWDAERDRRWPAPPKPTRITLLSWGAMEQDAQGQWCVWDDPDRGRLLSVTVSPWEHVRCFEDATAIHNRLAAQVAPERAK